MRESAGEANITVIVVVLIGIVAAAGAVLIPRLTDNTFYVGCCTEAGGVWSKGRCIAQTPTTCENREKVFQEYDKCVMENGKHNANEKYAAVSCD